MNDYYKGIKAFNAYRSRNDLTYSYDWADLSDHERKEWANVEELEEEYEGHSRN